MNHTTRQPPGRPPIHGERGKTFTIYVPPSIAEELIAAGGTISNGVMLAAAALRKKKGRGK